MSTGHVLLGLLSRRDQHGYELKHNHDGLFPHARPLAFGQVYAALDRLKKKGHVEALASERVDGPDRTVFSLTADGSTELGEWLASIDSPAPFVVNPMSVKATIALVAGGEGDARSYLVKQREAHLERMRAFTREKTMPDVDLATVLASDFAIAHLAADLDWLDLALQRVEALAPTNSTLMPTPSSHTNIEETA